MNDKILKKALHLLKEKKDRALCIKAHICPVCGEFLVVEPLKGEGTYEYRTFFGGKKIVSYNDDRYRTICLSNKSHYNHEHKYNYFYEEDNNDYYDDQECP